jgi:hypothetical protein
MLMSLILDFWLMFALSPEGSLPLGSFMSGLLLVFLSAITKCGGFKSILGNGARNASWYFLTPSLRLS